ncbi:MAG: type III pantothenate kinase [Helicobacteraceae bacterium]
MILCDIGNSRYHFYFKGKIWHEDVKVAPNFDAKGHKIYAISVNDAALERLQNSYSVILLNSFAALDTSYTGLGIDRATACLAIENGIVVDAGSAITVDVMQSFVHLGGFILPGLSRYQSIYGSISPILARSINLAVDLESLPQDTADAISFGIIGSIVELIKKTAKGKKIYFTGGDGAYLAKFFPNSIVDNSLVFKGMQKIIGDAI